jgi:hypothetical protein
LLHNLLPFLEAPRRSGTHRAPAANVTRAGRMSPTGWLAPLCSAASISASRGGSIRARCLSWMRIAHMPRRAAVVPLSRATSSPCFPLSAPHQLRNFDSVGTWRWAPGRGGRRGRRWVRSARYGSARFDASVCTTRHSQQLLAVGDSVGGMLLGAGFMARGSRRAGRFDARHRLQAAGDERPRFQKELWKLSRSWSIRLPSTRATAGANLARF